MPADPRLDAAALARLLGRWTRPDTTLPTALATAIGDLLASGVLADGTRLPSQRTLAQALGTARVTVTDAYERLRAGGQLVARPGSGARLVAPRSVLGSGVRTDGRLSSFTGHDAGGVDLSSGALPGLPFIAEAAARLDLAELRAELDRDGYHPAGLPRLRAAVAAQFDRDGLPTDAEQVLVTSGSQQALWLLAQVLVGPGDGVVVEEPTYRGALEVFRARGATLTSVPVRPDGPDLDLLAHALRRRPRVLYCQPVAHNPTGSSIGAGVRRALADLLAAHEDVVVVEDASSADLVLDDRGVRPFLATATPPDRTIVVGTASKLLWGGLRVGWVRAPHPVIARLIALRRAVDLGSAVIEQMLAADLLAGTDRARAERSSALRARLASTEDLLHELRPDWRWGRPAGGTALWVDTGGDAVALAERARRRGTSVVPGPAFSAHGGFGSHLRLPLWHPPEVLRQALEVLKPR
ncbi:PLP-dependent aminotransferase family protein [Modestobacter sp. NPDC049651]|uniref:aminotransferase-like domain-containing protein n=1 Tax=unclassified Modestobacter TaxID=2643866 RepID=UPI0033ED8F2C